MMAKFVCKICTLSGGMNKAPLMSRPPSILPSQSADFSSFEDLRRNLKQLSTPNFKKKIARLDATTHTC